MSLHFPRAGAASLPLLAALASLVAAPSARGQAATFPAPSDGPAPAEPSAPPEAEPDDGEAPSTQPAGDEPAADLSAPGRQPATDAPVDDRASDAPVASEAPGAEASDAAPSDAEPSDAEPPDAEPSDAEPVEAATSGAEELSAEELAAIADAIGADADATDEPASAAATAPPPAAPSTAGQLGQATARMLQSMNPDMSFILDVAGAWFSPGFSLTGQPGSAATGNYQLGAHDPSQTGFNLQQLELFVAASVDPFFRLQGNIVFSKFGVEIEEAFATSTSLPWGFQARIGQFLTRFGRKNPTHVHSWHFVDQPLVNGKFFGAEGNRGLGVELSWLAPLPWYLEVFGSVNEANDACCARSYFGGDVLPVISPLDLLATGGLKQFFPLGSDLSLFWGLSAQSGPNPTGKNNRTEMVGTDLYLRYRPINSPGRTAISWTTEAIVRRMQVPGTVLTDAGMYSQIVAQFMLQFELGARVEAVSGNIGDPLDPGWTGVRTRYSAQATYYPSHFSRIRGQLAYGAQGDVTQAAWLQPVHQPVLAVFIAFEFLVGAHGSHGF